MWDSLGNSCRIPIGHFVSQQPVSLHISFALGHKKKKITAVGRKFEKVDAAGYRAICRVESRAVDLL